MLENGRRPAKVSRGVSTMGPSQVTSAIVLRSRLYGESDKIVTFLTEDFGKLTGIAKGAVRSRRRFVNSLEPFAIVKLYFQDRPHGGLVFLNSAELQVGYKQFGDHLERLAYAAYIVEITEGLLAERETLPSVYRHLADALCHLEQRGVSLRFLTAFELKLLRLAGFQPMLASCKRCMKTHSDVAADSWHLSPADGGVLCVDCGKSRHMVWPLGAAAMRILNQLQSETSDLSERIMLPATSVRELRAAIVGFIQYQMDKEIKSAGFLHKYSMPQNAAS
jgi:DNA repair protein RecO (recombination protein O)